MRASWPSPSLAPPSKISFLRLWLVQRAISLLLYGNATSKQVIAIPSCDFMTCQAWMCYAFASATDSEYDGMHVPWYIFYLNAWDVLICISLMRYAWCCIILWTSLYSILKFRSITVFNHWWYLCLTRVLSNWWIVSVKIMTLMYFTGLITYLLTNLKVQFRP